MSDIRTILTENLNELVRRKNIKAVELAERLGISKSAVSHWLAGDNSPNIEILAKICELYDVKLSEMLNEKIEMTYAEKEFLKKYRKIDKFNKHGIEILEAVADVECKYIDEIYERPALKIAKSQSDKPIEVVELSEDKLANAPPQKY